LDGAGQQLPVSNYRVDYYG